MRVICLVLFTTALAASTALAQLGDPPAALYAGADVVFVGLLEKLTPSPSGLSARFFLIHPIKGTAKINTEVRVQIPAEGRCQGFEERHRYLIYGRKVRQELWVDPCEGSKLISQAEADLRYIHTLNPRVSERCSPKRLRQLAAGTPIVATAKVIRTEDSAQTDPLLRRPWCGLAWSSEFVYYDVQEVLKGQIPDEQIAVDHAICWDTVTVDGYVPALSPELFREDNVLLLFLDRGLHRIDQVQPPFPSGYEDVDEYCGAVDVNSDAAQGIVEALHGAR